MHTLAFIKKTNMAVTALVAAVLLSAGTLAAVPQHAAACDYIPTWNVTTTSGATKEFLHWNKQSAMVAYVIKNADPSTAPQKVTVQNGTMCIYKPGPWHPTSAAAGSAAAYPSSYGRSVPVWTVKAQKTVLINNKWQPKTYSRVFKGWAEEPQLTSYVRYQTDVRHGFSFVTVKSGELPLPMPQ